MATKSKSKTNDKPATSERVIHTLRASVSTDGNGIVENVQRGWTSYDHPNVVAARAAGKIKRDERSIAYFTALYQS